MNTQEKTLLTLKEQAASLSISWRHLQELTKKRAVPHVRLGRRILFNPEAVREAIERNHTVRSL